MNVKTVKRKVRLNDDPCHTKVATLRSKQKDMKRKKKKSSIKAIHSFFFRSLSFSCFTFEHPLPFAANSFDR